MFSEQWLSSNPGRFVLCTMVLLFCCEIHAALTGYSKECLQGHGSLCWFRKDMFHCKRLFLFCFCFPACTHGMLLWLFQCLQDISFSDSFTSAKRKVKKKSINELTVLLILLQKEREFSCAKQMFGAVSDSNICSAREWATIGHFSCWTSKSTQMM